MLWGENKTWAEKNKRQLHGHSKTSYHRPFPSSVPRRAQIPITKTTLARPRWWKPPGACWEFIKIIKLEGFFKGICWWNMLANMPIIWEYVDYIFGNILGIGQAEPNQLEDVFFIFCWLLGSSNPNIPRARKKHQFSHPGTMMGVKLQPEVEDP